MAGSELVDQDKLIPRGLKFHGFHGVKPEEKKLGQKFVIDVDAWLDLRAAGVSDDIADTVSYTDIYRCLTTVSNLKLESPCAAVDGIIYGIWIVKDVVEGPSQNLLESVAHLIANTTFLKFSQISAVRVKVGKPHVAS
ncbi:hypothetical protein LUZ62_023340 [Rhynchospora pubera]|uniref:dihydroneopterin aldolase n=1 Tax=Rhynchospora pubera TaxID=906938 RepID=A0AAV8H230_9POAL|nr:hypothetical protein LUZ62_023340 [Rhynchospora pubera]